MLRVSATGALCNNCHLYEAFFVVEERAMEHSPIIITSNNVCVPQRGKYM